MVQTTGLEALTSPKHKLLVWTIGLLAGMSRSAGWLRGDCRPRRDTKWSCKSRRGL